MDQVIIEIAKDEKPIQEKKKDVISLGKKLLEDAKAQAVAKHEDHFFVDSNMIVDQQADSTNQQLDTIGLDEAKDLMSGNANKG